MFFHESNFSHVLTDDQANLIAKIANDILDRQAKVMYGEHYQNGSGANFSTAKKRTDSHVCLAVGISELGLLKPSESPIALEKPREEDVVRAQADRLRLQENEIRQLREMKK